MDEALFSLATVLTVAAFLSQIVGFAMAKQKTRRPLIRILLFLLWCGLLWFLGILLFSFNYCESGCSGRPVNGPTWFIHAGWFLLNVGTSWLALRGLARLP
jgi:hypothetical protein